MSHDALELLREKKAREYVINEFRQRAIVMTWEEDKAGTVTVFQFVHDMHKQRDTHITCVVSSHCDGVAGVQLWSGRLVTLFRCLPAHQKILTPELLC